MENPEEAFRENGPLKMICVVKSGEIKVMDQFLRQGYPETINSFIFVGKAVPGFLDFSIFDQTLK